MDADPYIGMYRLFSQRESTGGTTLPGMVLRAGGAPLRIAVAGLEVDAEDLRCASSLVWQYDEDTGAAEQLRAGDAVLLFTADYQDFCVLCKVVPARG